MHFNSTREGYGACLRHGLIPNLLDKGVSARFNCRDAIWWWLHSIMAFVDEAPNGHEIFKEVVIRLYPDDAEQNKEQKLEDVIFEALEKHFKVCLVE